MKKLSSNHSFSLLPVAISISNFLFFFSFFFSNFFLCPFCMKNEYIFLSNYHFIQHVSHCTCFCILLFYVVHLGNLSIISYKELFHSFFVLPGTTCSIAWMYHSSFNQSLVGPKSYDILFLQPVLPRITLYIFHARSTISGSGSAESKPHTFLRRCLTSLPSQQWRMRMPLP